jgi:hypothetical protein
LASLIDDEKKLGDC